MRFLIGKPVRHLDFFRSAGEQGLAYNKDIEQLYETLPKIIERLGYDCITIDVSKNIRRIYQEKNSIFLAWHNHGTTKNTWFIKSGYMPDYFYFDKTGYSGWSELAEKYEYEVDVDTIRDEVQTIADHYITNNISRFDQSFTEDIPDSPYVLVFEQRRDDAVYDFAYIDEIAARVKEVYKGTKYKVFVKQHPFNLEMNNGVWRWTINDKTGSLHQLIAKSSAVYTINSSAGFEALLHGKRVFTTGHCDYHWATTTLKTDEDIKNSVTLIEQPVDKDRIIKFLHYCFNHYFMNVNDEKSIEQKIQKAVDWYQRSEQINSTRSLK